VAAGEDQLESLVGNGSLLVLRDPFGAGEQLGLALERPLAADAVDRPVAGGRDDPRTRVRRDAVARPAFRGAYEGVLDRVLGEVEVAENAAEDRDRAGALVAVRADQLVYCIAS
jgi:hypothetical protein